MTLNSCPHERSLPSSAEKCGLSPSHRPGAGCRAGGTGKVSPARGGGGVWLLAAGRGRTRRPRARRRRQGARDVVSDSPRPTVPAQWGRRTGASASHCAGHGVSPPRPHDRAGGRGAGGGRRALWAEALPSLHAGVWPPRSASRAERQGGPRFPPLTARRSEQQADSLVLSSLTSLLRVAVNACRHA